MQNTFWIDKFKIFKRSVSLIDSDTTITQAVADSYTCPVTVNAGVSVTLGENLSFDSVSNYFVIGGNGVTINGNNKIVTINNISNYSGLIQNGTIESNGYSNTTIKNIGVETTGTTTLADGGGWICQSNFGKGVLNCIVYNCYSTGTISLNAGGICGSHSGNTSGSCIIYNCYSNGLISGNNAGGICGYSAGSGFNDSSCIVYNCYSTGSISGSEAGGICGSYAGSDCGSCIVYNCYTTGEISGFFSGGIYGNGAGHSGNCIAYNCYTTGFISGDEAGGISGNSAGNNGSFIAYNCYATGIISGEYSGGICGTFAGNNGSCIIHSCTYNDTNLKLIIGGGSFTTEILLGTLGINEVSFFSDSAELTLPDTGFNYANQTPITNNELKNLLNEPNKIIINNNSIEIFNIAINPSSPYLTTTILSEETSSDWTTLGDPNSFTLDIENHPIIGTEIYNPPTNSSSILLLISIKTLDKLANNNFEIIILDIVRIKGKYMYLIFFAPLQIK